jgi:hypothetical protein
MPVHMMKKIMPKPANMDPNVAAISSTVRLLFSFGLLIK